MQKERKMFIVETKREFDNLKFIEACYLDTPIDVCKARVRERRNHPTLGRATTMLIFFIDAPDSADSS